MTCDLPSHTSAQLGQLVVTITSPADGATVAGTTTVGAAVTIVGSLTVQGVQFKVDGNNIGAEDQSAPYAVTWDTTSAGNGVHSLTAVARDLLGARWTSDPVSVTVSNDTTPPTVTMTAPADGATVNGAAIVRASAADNVGVAGVQFLLDGVSLGAEDSSLPYSVSWDTTGVSDGPHALSARVRDAAGNTATSAAVMVTVDNAPAPAPGATRFEDTEPSIIYTPGTADVGRSSDWWQGSRSRDWSGRTASVNRSNGARATFAFSGTAVSWIGFRAPWAGIARVFVDGALASEVDLFATTELVQTPVFEATGLAAGPHTLAVEATGRKHGGDQCSGPVDCASDWAVFVDAFDVAGAAPPPTHGTRIEETASSVTYSGAWTQGDRSRGWSGATAATAAIGGARATLAFVGTSVSWIGLRGSQTGIARVYLDGSFQAVVDTFSSPDIQAVIYTASSLAPARHIVTIETTGSKNSAATDTRIVVDAFDVQSRVEDTDRAIAYSGSWIKESAARAWSGTSANTGTATAALSATAGASADFTFTGNAVSWIGFRSPLAGIAAVSLDGASAGEIDLYAPTEAVQVSVFTATGLADGTHTLSISVTGRRNPAATGAYVIVDAFDVALPQSVPTVTRLQDDDPSIAYTSSTDWSPNNRYKFFSGELAKTSTTAGARATLSFTGTGVRWIGQRRQPGDIPTGVARVYLDGSLVGQIDTLASLQEENQAAIFTATGVSPGSHTLTIEVVGRNGEPPGSAVDPIVIDAFDLLND